MRHQIRLAGLVISISLISSVTVAAQMFGGTFSAQQPVRQYFPVPRVLSAADFSSKVSSLVQETNGRLAQQVADALPKKTQAQALPPQAAQQNQSSTVAASEPEPTASPSTAETAPMNAPAPTRFPTPPKTNSASAPAAAPSSQGYTGFGAGNTNQPKQQGSDKSTGWNIQY